MDVVEAIAKAKEYAMVVFGEDAVSPPRLKGVVPVDDSSWDVTLSFKRASPLASGGLAINLAPHLVNYQKLLRVDRVTGDLISIKDADYGS